MGRIINGISGHISILQYVVEDKLGHVLSSILTCFSEVLVATICCWEVSLYQEGECHFSSKSAFSVETTFIPIFLYPLHPSYHSCHPSILHAYRHTRFLPMHIAIPLTTLPTPHTHFPLMHTGIPLPSPYPCSYRPPHPS